MKIEGKMKKMGAVLWSILGLISVLVSGSLPTDSGGGRAQASELQLDKPSFDFPHRLAKRSDSPENLSVNDTATCEEVCGDEKDFKTEQEEEFVSLVCSQPYFEAGVSPPILVHASSPGGDTLTYWNGQERKQRCFSAPLYRTLKILSHFPVRVAILNHLNKTAEARSELNQLIAELVNFPELSENETIDQWQNFLRKIDENLNSSNITTLFSTKYFTNIIEENAGRAAMNYIEGLTEAMSSLFTSQSVADQLVIYVRGLFAYNESFLVEYYKRRFKMKAKIVLQPTFAEDGNCSSCSTSICDSGNISASIEALDRNISEVFRELNKHGSSIHNFFDVVAVDVLCSDSSNWTACPQKDTKPLRGFETRTEKAYVVLFVFFGACSVVLGIVLLSICYEDRLMKAERRLSSSSISGSNHKDYNRERPLSGMSMQSNEED